eukprot:scaffold302005_cov17-Tisochrysis_lutea.AAC.1
MSHVPKPYFVLRSCSSRVFTGLHVLQAHPPIYFPRAIGNVLAEHVSPKAWNEAPVPFGGEATPLEICEFAEVFNGSEEDPGSWPAVITNLLVGGGYEATRVSNREPAGEGLDVTRTATILSKNSGCK